MTKQSCPTRGELLGQGRTAEVYAWGDDRVLKLYHAGWLASWAEREAHLTTLIAAAGLPAPAVERVIEVDGRHGILFERIVGPSLVRRFETKPWTLLRSVRAFTDLHLAMHAHIIPDLPSQREHLARQIQDAPTVPDRIRAAALMRLQHLPDGNAVCHGDYHPDNVLVTRRGPIVIDWGGATRGHPLADVARTALLLQIGELPPSRPHRWLLAPVRTLVHRGYVRRYLRLTHTRMEDLAAWRLPIVVARLAEGIAEEQTKLLALAEAACSSPALRVS